MYIILLLLSHYRNAFSFERDITYDCAKTKEYQDHEKYN